MRDQLSKALIMGCDQQGRTVAIRRFDQQRSHPRSIVIVQCRCRFVRDQQAGPAYERARDRRSLGLALAQATGLGGGAVGDPQLGKQPVNRIVRRGMTAQPSGQMQILPHGQSRNKAQRLEDQADLVPPKAAGAETRE